jgi:hypothetical protein
VYRLAALGMHGLRGRLGGGGVAWFASVDCSWQPVDLGRAPKLRAERVEVTR